MTDAKIYRLDDDLKIVERKVAILENEVQNLKREIRLLKGEEVQEKRGKDRFGSHLKDFFSKKPQKDASPSKECHHCHTKEGIQYRPMFGVWLCDLCYRKYQEPHKK